MDLLKKLHEEEGKTIIQVTHNENWAKYGNRIIHLLDGWLTEEQAVGKEASENKT